MSSAQNFAKAFDEGIFGKVIGGTLELPHSVLAGLRGVTGGDGPSASSSSEGGFLSGIATLVAGKEVSSVRPEQRETAAVQAPTSHDVSMDRIGNFVAQNFGTGGRSAGAMLG